eukprot:9206592-Pyramimonas_sp.AAC.1
MGLSDLSAASAGLATPPSAGPAPASPLAASRGASEDPEGETNSAAGLLPTPSVLNASKVSCPVRPEGVLFEGSRSRTCPPGENGNYPVINAN